MERVLIMKGKELERDVCIKIGKPYKQGTKESIAIQSSHWFNGLEKIGLEFTFHTEALINYIHMLVKSKTAQNALSNREVGKCSCKIVLGD